ncbi:ECF transporter S component [Kocuria sp.]|uniref:ECF transporter S component n=1 Tax=Kocuria sp. TaxID=1871328 RepID=UPI0026DD6C39|nr:ECF transporter S component [Kocuria sp.]MDO4918240.1 ECF transporter S component [Kocuria sp.]
MPEPTRPGSAPEGAPEPPAPGAESYDDIARGLHELRVRAGGVSYARITQRIERARRAQGVDEYGARLARSTVYDAFRSGRTRLSADLVAEIALALGEDAAGASRWRERCLRARPAPPSPPAGAAAPAPVVAPAHGPVTDELPRAAVASAGAEDVTADHGQRAHPRRPAPRVVLTVLLLCLALNVAGKYLNRGMRLPLHMDMAGTAVSAIALGPWYGAAVGMAGNAFGTLTDGPGALLFAPVNVVGALIWGYGVHRFCMGRTLVSYFRLCVLAAVGCTLTAVPVILLLFPGRELGLSGTLGQALGSAGTSLLIAVFSANGAYSMVDKLLTGFVALVVLQRVHARVPSLGSVAEAIGSPRMTGRSRRRLHAQRGMGTGGAVRECPESPEGRGS